MGIWSVNPIISLRLVEDKAHFGNMNAEYQPEVLVAQSFALPNSAWNQVIGYPEAHSIDLIVDH